MSKIRRFRWNGRTYRLMEVEARFTWAGMIDDIVLVMHAGGRREAVSIAKYALAMRDARQLCQQ